MTTRSEALLEIQSYLEVAGITSAPWPYAELHRDHDFVDPLGLFHGESEMSVSGDPREFFLLWPYSSGSSWLIWADLNAGPSAYPQKQRPMPTEVGFGRQVCYAADGGR